VVGRVGSAHVAIGLDYMFGELNGDLPPGSRSEEWWPPGNEYDVEDMKVVPPERFPEITAGLLARNYAEADVAAILGGNMMRVARASWL
jgi:membrane dipeptidase